MWAEVCTEHPERHTLPRRSSRLKIAGQVPCIEPGGTCCFTTPFSDERQHHWEASDFMSNCFTNSTRAAIIRAMPPPRVVTTYTMLSSCDPTPRP